MQTVRLGATSSIVHAWLTDLLHLLRESFPNLTVELTVDTTPRLRASFVTGELDVAILMGPVHEAGVRYIPLRTYRTAWIASDDIAHCLGETALTLDALAKYWIVTHARDSATYGALEELFRLNGLWPLQLNSCNSVEAILRMTRSGLAIGAISEACVSRNDPTLRTLRCDLDLPSYQFFASYHLDAVGRSGMIVAELARETASRHGAGY
jgi:DNA-binding transcriptional LysR family regulator